MPFLKQSYISFANPKLHEAQQFSKILSQSLDPNAHSALLFKNIQILPLSKLILFAKLLFYAFPQLQQFSKIL
jgi:hypothetical protein